MAPSRGGETPLLPSACVPPWPSDIQRFKYIVQRFNYQCRSLRGEFNDLTAGRHAHSVVTARLQAEALFRLGEWVVENGVDAAGPHRAARDLLLCRPPRLRRSSSDDAPLHKEGEQIADAARRLALELDGGVLAIQGPPGAGKTYTGARMICDLVRAGKKVGITAVSHKVIRNLLDGVVEAAAEGGLSVRCVQKVGEKPAKDEGLPIRETTKNKDVVALLDAGEAQIAAGTAWLWSRDELHQSIDVLFVDEAGQMSLANVLAVAQAARSTVLLGDPQQLDQPLKGSHPEGTEVSALQHLLGDRVTIPAHRGLFLAETWRLHPSICTLTSELFYEGRLESRPDLGQQELVGRSPFAGAGLWFVPVEHEGNQNSSLEEVERVAELHATLLAGNLKWATRLGIQAPLTERDILIVAPYNAQVGALGERLPTARIGTVDKFQGQEAPVVIYSMATSSPDEAPRGMEFLFSVNRLNVATSPARGDLNPSAARRGRSNLPTRSVGIWSWRGLIQCRGLISESVLDVMLPFLTSYVPSPFTGLPAGVSRLITRKDTPPSSRSGSATSGCTSCAWHPMVVLWYARHMSKVETTGKGDWACRIWT